MTLPSIAAILFAGLLLPPHSANSAWPGSRLQLRPGGPLAAPAPAQAPAAPVTGQDAQAGQDELWEAARAGDAGRVSRALDRGTDVNARTRYGVTALAFAADKGHIDVVRLLLARGADVNVSDSFYGMSAIDMALSNDRLAVAALLLERGSKGAANALMAGIDAKDAGLVRLALASPDLTAAHVNSALALAKRGGDAATIALVEAKAAALPPDATPKITVAPAVLQTFAGAYRNDSGLSVTFAVRNDQLFATPAGQPELTLVPISQNSFGVLEADGITFAFGGRGGLIEQVIFTRGTQTIPLPRVIAGVPASSPGAAPPAAAAATPAPMRPVTRTAARPWPGFRGSNAAGNGDGQGAIAEWNAAANTNIRWKTPIPGIANASPVIWGDRVFITTAISSAKDATFRTGLYGDVKPVDDLSSHTWKLYCLDKATGKILWEQTAYTGIPKVKRHTKSSQASSTPVTDGRHVVAIFGTVGLLAAWDVSGKPLWTTDLGTIDSGWFFDPEYQWGHSSSPIVYKNTVIVQADQQKGSFLAAYDLDSGTQVWRTGRDEISTWGTPAIVEQGGRAELVTNGPKIRGYDPATGALRWTLGPNSEITVGSPVAGDGLVYVTGGYPPVRPVYAVKPGGSGDISLPKEKTSSDAVAWSNSTEGTYIPTPIFYDGLLYTLNNNGVLTAYDGKTGERIYRARVGGGGSFSASPIAADGRLYIPSEDGDVFVVRAGRTYEELAKNEMKEVIMATPAISDGLIVIRTLGNVYGIGAK